LLPYSGRPCPIGVPVQCGAWCVQYLSTFCADTTAPHSLLPFDQTFSNSQDNYFDVFLNSFDLVATIAIPAGALFNDTGYPDPLHTFSVAPLLLPPPSQETIVVVSALFNLTIAAYYQGTIIVIPSFTNPLQMTFSNTSYNGSLDNACLGYINETTWKWECEDSNLTRTNEGIVGYTHHFTTFGLLLTVSPPPNSGENTSPGQITHSSLPYNDLIAIVVCVIFVVVVTLSAVIFYKISKARNTGVRRLSSSNQLQVEDSGTTVQ